MKIYIIHGTKGSPDGNWFPWLKEKLEKFNHEVIIPKFPTPEGQNLENWTKIFNEYDLDENTIIIGHSLAPAFILNILEKRGPIKAAFLIAGFLGEINNEEFDNLNKSFMKEFDWKKIKSNCKKFIIINSNDDPYVPIEKGWELSKNLGSPLTILSNAGHMNEESGYKEFPFFVRFD